MRDVREEHEAERAINEAYQKWPRADEAWEAVTWALSRDPFGAGPPLTESGKTRIMVFDGARSIGMPSVRAVYVIEPDRVIVHKAVFEEAKDMYAGHA